MITTVARSPQSKMKSLEDLAVTLATLRSAGSRIVHCHGVFDLLHIGHIRHFEQARHMGDVLVVTVTPDRFVNKGPHRPVFNEALRAEAIAALDAVDFVAINQSPTAVEALEMLRPHVYVKGSDYRDAAADRTGGITAEENAVRAVGGHLAFTQDITFSSSSLINRHLAVLPKDVSDYIQSFASRYSAADVLRYLDDARPLKVLIVGEAIIDEYQYCEAIGKSSKEPMLAMRQLSTERFAGGSLAVGNHVANFVDAPTLVAFLGAENPHIDFIESQLNPSIARHFLYRKGAPTIVKRRFVESYFFTKLLEIYEMAPGGLENGDSDALCESLERAIPEHDVVVVMDFGHGMIGPRAVETLCAKSKFLAVNAQSNADNLGFHTISKYPRADYVCIAEKEIRLEGRNRDGALDDLIVDVAEKLDCGRVMVTRGKNGCTCYSRTEGFVTAPAVANSVVDRMGAGDAFLSLTALCVAQKAPMEVVAFIGNVVGAEAVRTVGHRRPIERLPLYRHIESLLK